jgi:hypothetical protein
MYILIIRLVTIPLLKLDNIFLKIDFWLKNFQMLIFRENFEKRKSYSSRWKSWIIPLNDMEMGIR